MAYSPVTRIDIKTFLQQVDKPTQTVLKILHDHHVPTRIVGGAVRDILLNRKPRDIDLVVDADPSELIFLFELYNIPTDTGGIAHGTVKAVFGYAKTENKVDVSCLGYRLKMQDHKVKITKADNWAQDAAMRDLSINSMSMDLKGQIWDYENGYDDLRSQRVRMLDITKHHIDRDPNVIMRYFKAVSMFADPKLVRADLDQIAREAHLLSNIPDDERVIKNLITIQKSANGKKIVALMCKLGFKQYLPSVPC